MRILERIVGVQRTEQSVGIIVWDFCHSLMYTNYSVLPQLYQSNGLAADSQLFVCRDNCYFYFGVSSRDHAVVTALCILPVLLLQFLHPYSQGSGYVLSLLLFSPAQHNPVCHLHCNLHIPSQRTYARRYVHNQLF